MQENLVFQKLLTDLQNTILIKNIFIVNYKKGSWNNLVKRINVIQWVRSSQRL